MAVLPTKTFNQIVATISAGMQGRITTRILNFSVGSALLATAEAVAGTCMWLQRRSLAILQLTRLATSFGSDVDSWLADWGLITRIGSVAATGLVTLGRNTVGAAAPVTQVGSTVRSQDGTLTFQIYADPSNPNYNGSTGYVLAAYVKEMLVPVVCITPSPNGTVNADGTVSSGANGNVAAGAISKLSSQMIGIDYVTNPAAFTNGSDSEQDVQLKARWPVAVQSLRLGTPVAIQSAIQALSTNLQVVVLDGEAADGTVTPGLVTVIVDDGSGAISGVLLAEAQAAVEATRAGGVRSAVFAGQIVPISVQMSLTPKTGYTRSIVAAQIAATVASAINTLGLEGDVPYMYVGALAQGVPGVKKIDNLLVNNGIIDIMGDPRYTPKCTGVVVN